MCNSTLVKVVALSDFRVPHWLLRLSLLLVCQPENFSDRDATMKLAWHFNKVNPRFKNREATQGEFFTNDTELRGFIREAVQNSLDARRPRVKAPVRVRIFVSGEKAALTAEKAERYFRGGWEHFHAEGSGLREAPAAGEACRFIAYEDSGTTGLTGDVQQYHEVPGVKNPFYYFFRAEGQSNKTEGGRGRWGLGKFVFPRSSRIRSFFGLTVRHDDKKRLLVGQSILRSHHVGEKSFTPDGWFGKKPDRNEASLPVHDQRFINKFVADFRLKRAYDPGLSLVVPYCDERWTPMAVTEAIVQDYFYPILRNDLIVTIEDADSKVVLDAQSLLTETGKLRAGIQQTMRPLLELTTWALKQPAEDNLFSVQPGPAASGSGPATSIDPASLNPELLTSVRAAFHKHRRVAVRIPLTVEQTGGPEKISHFEAFIERAEGSSQKRPMFIRDGIVISDVRTRQIRDVHAIVTINDRPLTALLGDAENPAHTEWSEESSHFKGKYRNGAATLRLVRNSVADLCQMLVESADDQDPVLLLDVFSLGTAHGQAGVPVNFPAMSSKSAVSNLLRLKALGSQPRKSKPFQVTSRKGGFRVAGRTDRRLELPALDVFVAYDRRGGSPLRKYTTTDFRLDQQPVSIKTRNAIVQILEGNHLVIYPQKSDFDVVVTGFDLNRDLFVQAKQTPQVDSVLKRAG